MQNGLRPLTLSRVGVRFLTMEDFATGRRHTLCIFHLSFFIFHSPKSSIPENVCHYKTAPRRNDSL